MLVSICIGSVRSKSLPWTVASLRAQTYQDWELIIVAQGNDAALIDYCRTAASEDPRVSYIHEPVYGLSRAHNVGLDRSRGEIIAFTDDDCEADSEWLAVIVDSFARHPEVGVVGGSVRAPEGANSLLSRCTLYEAVEAVYDPAVQPRVIPQGFDWIGANFAIRRATVTQVGRFDECLGPGARLSASEDVDYKLRCEAANITMMSTPRMIIRHTYGVRRGWREILKYQQDYAIGNGALAAKLTLSGDPRGKEWLVLRRRDVITALQRGNVAGALRASIGLRHFQTTYARCIREYRYDTDHATLVLARTGAV